jgi:hypothetical protein
MVWMRGDTCILGSEYLIVLFTRFPKQGWHYVEFVQPTKHNPPHLSPRVSFAGPQATVQVMTEAPQVEITGHLVLELCVEFGLNTVLACVVSTGGVPAFWC